jgi:hypothetical protein
MLLQAGFDRHQFVTRAVEMTKVVYEFVPPGVYTNTYNFTVATVGDYQPKYNFGSKVGGEGF